MTPEEFITKWRAVTVSEIAASQSHFNDLCELIEEPKPLDTDPTGKSYAFEKQVRKLDGRPGRADVWKKGCFAWEYKRVNRYKSLVGAYAQLKEYSDALENPPLLIVCDISEIQIHTNFTSAVKTVHVIKLGELNDITKIRLLKHAFSQPHLLRPETTREQATKDAARDVAFIARRLRDGGNEAERVAHFLNKLVFCMFAESIELLPEYLFSELLEQARDHPENFKGMAEGLFRAMQNQNGFHGNHRIPWFNGGLFADSEVLPLGHAQILDLYKVALLDWSAIEPPIFGTLFERGLDPEKRSQLASLLGERQGGGVGIHYTDPDKIMKIVEPVVLRPLRAELGEARARIQAELDKKEAAKSLGARTRADNAARQIYAEFLDRLANYRVLDPACGSGNFLYVALLRLKDFEMAVLAEAEEIGLPREFPRIGPESVMGIEINPYAAELARLVVWIGEIQWQLKSGYNFKREPILRPLNQIECRDALINPDGTEAEWPKVDAIIGNPPFLGAKKMISGLGDRYVSRLRSAFSQLPGFIDLVSYWFEKSRFLVVTGETKKVGFVATNSIAMGTNLSVMNRISADTHLFEAWSDEEWTVDGANVRVALICFENKQHNTNNKLDGADVKRIGANLRSSKNTFTDAVQIIENEHVAFVGIQKTGPFDIPGALARRWLDSPSKDSERPNSDVLKPHLNGIDISRQNRDVWIVDFGVDMKEILAKKYELPYRYVLEFVKPFRQTNKEIVARDNWWIFWRSRPELRFAIRNLSRVIVTPEVTKHRVFAWRETSVSFDKNLTITARDDDTTFGILHSRFHEQWSLRLCTWLGVGNDPRYTPTTTFETFPFPEGLTPNIPAADYAADPRATQIAEAAKALNEAREAWLNPPELVKRVPEVVPGYPDRILAIDPRAAEILKSRTLTKLYNERPAWLSDLHRALDHAVARAYGWPEDISDDDALSRLFALNQERATKQSGG